MGISRDKPEHALAEVATVSPCSDCESAVFDESPLDLRHHSESTFWWRGAVLGASHYAAAWSAQVTSGLFGRPAAQNGIKALMACGFHKPGDVENRLGYYLGQIAR